MAHTDLSIVIASSADDPRKLNKTYSGGIQTSCYVKEPCDLYNPSFILNYNGSYLSKNYIYVPAWGRYYFIDDITLDVGGKCVITATEDVLMSFKSQILGIDATIVRAGDLNQANMYINDGSAINNQYTDEFILEFGYSFAAGKSSNEIMIIAM